MNTNSPNLIRDLNGSRSDTANSMTQGLPFVNFFVIVSIAVIAGITLGFILAKTLNKSPSSTAQNITSEKSAGIADKKTFKDAAEGILKEGGVDGEGNFHLQRPGGESQNVYLTSSTVDLSKYIGKKIKVWGETFQAEKAGWLMDVGLVEILQ